MVGELRHGLALQVVLLAAVRISTLVPKGLPGHQARRMCLVVIAKLSVVP